jgi:hypothetical protein
MGKSRKCQFGLLELFIIAVAGYMLVLLFVHLMKTCTGMIDCLSVSSTIISPFITLLAVGYVGASIYGYKFSRLHDVYMDLKVEMDIVVENYNLIHSAINDNKDELYNRKARMVLSRTEADPSERLRDALFRIEYLNKKLKSINPHDTISQDIDKHFLGCCLKQLLYKYDYVFAVNKVKEIAAEIPDFGKQLENIRNIISKNLKSNRL